jgi:hypothetical protein
MQQRSDSGIAEQRVAREKVAPAIEPRAHERRIEKARVIAARITGTRPRNSLRIEHAPAKIHREERAKQNPAEAIAEVHRD